MGWPMLPALGRLLLNRVKGQRFFEIARQGFNSFGLRDSPLLTGTVIAIMDFPFIFGSPAVLATVALDDLHPSDCTVLRGSR
jgi:hypothetical protein